MPGLRGSSESPLGGRLPLLAVLIAAVFGVFFLRLFQLQVIRGERYAEISRNNAVRLQRLEPPRGEIRDRNGHLLAGVRPAFDVAVIPRELREGTPVIDALAGLLGTDRGRIAERIGRPRGRRRFQPALIAADLPPDRAARVEAHRYALPGVVTSLRPLRRYPEGELVAHLIGHTGEITARQLESGRFTGYRPGESVGQTGMEAVLEPWLRGQAGGRNVVVDAHGREVAVENEVLPRSGHTAVLAIDLDLQRAAFEAFESEEPGGERKTGAIVALDPRNGDVLAMVSSPSFDPNLFVDGIGEADWRRLRDDELRPLQNRAISGQYAPGSTFKPFVAAAALEEGTVGPGERIFCPGHFTLGSRTYRCWRRSGHGEVGLEEALRSSCDVYFYQVGVRLGVDRIAYFARAFGLGRPTGIALREEKAGLVPTTTWKERRTGEPWMRGETVSVSIGQGAVLVTPLQLAVAYAALANGGVVVQPRLLLRIEDLDGRVVEEVPPRVRATVPVDARHLARIARALESAVSEPGGTGVRARIEGVRVAGKTGTTQVVSLRRVEGLEGDDVPRHYRDHGWFAAFAPVEAPEIVVVALAEHGGGGGSTAAPMARHVLERYFARRGPEPGLERASGEGPSATSPAATGGRRRAAG